MSLWNRADLLQRNDALAFEDSVVLIGGKILDYINRSRWPADLYAVDRPCIGQTKVNSQITLREITTAAANRLRLCYPCRDDFDPRADALFRERGARLITCITECSVLLVEAKMPGLAITRPRWQRVDLR